MGVVWSAVAVVEWYLALVVDRSFCLPMVRFENIECFVLKVHQMHAEEALTYPGSSPPNILINDQVVLSFSLDIRSVHGKTRSMLDCLEVLIIGDLAWTMINQDKEN